MSQSAKPPSPPKPSSSNRGRRGSVMKKVDYGQGVSIPSWLMQLLGFLGFVGAAIGYIFNLRSDIELLKQTQVKIEKQQQEYVLRELFNSKMEEQSNTNKRIENKIDTVETLVRGLYNTKGSR